MEAEEALREAAALGNIAAIKIYINNGVHINASNRTNGWTPLHWACSRGNKEAAQLLIANGAKIDIANNNGMTPVDVAKGDALKWLQSVNGEHPLPSENSSDTPPETGSFIPNYLRFPDLNKAWSVPESIPTQVRSVYETALAKPQSDTSANQPKSSLLPKSMDALASPLQQTNTGWAKSEVLVFKDQFKSDAILGAVFIDRNTTIAELCKQIQAEIDNVPMHFKLARLNDRYQIPLSKGQYNQQAWMHFNGGYKSEQLSSVLILIETSESS